MNIHRASVGSTDSLGETLEGATIIERLTWCVVNISLGCDRWDDPHAHGPGLYFVVERDPVTAFAKPMGANRWPVEDCETVFAPLDALIDTAASVASGCDGGVIVHNDGAVEEQMMRLTQVRPGERTHAGELPYAGWMGARHMSALETSTRPEVLAAITLSEEDGRVTVFIDGMFEDYPRGTLAAE